jgi:hypothetical protein
MRRKRFPFFREILVGLVGEISVILLPSMTTAPAEAALILHQDGPDVSLFHAGLAVVQLGAAQLRALALLLWRAADMIEAQDVPMEEAA